MKLQETIGCTVRFFSLVAFSAILLFSSCATLPEPVERRSLLDLIDYFDNIGLPPEKVSTTRHQALLAADGCVMWIEGAKVEFYIYDVTIPNQKEKLDKIRRENKIEVLTYNVEAVVNGGIVMLLYSTHPSVAKISRAFRKFPPDYKISTDKHKSQFQNSPWPRGVLKLAHNL
ncbi:MAG: hypothetical protein JW808_06650 [Victivallales bacterium]|nr:hypothetical protein [Victivallales bacterium]